MHITAQPRNDCLHNVCGEMFPGKSIVSSGSVCVCVCVCVLFFLLLWVLLFLLLFFLCSMLLFYVVVFSPKEHLPHFLSH